MIAGGWRDRGYQRSVYKVAQRAWLVPALLALAACGKGTSGWVLSEHAPASVTDGGAGGGPASDSGGSFGQGGDAGLPGQVMTGGADAGGGVTAIAPRCPTRFVSVCSPSIVVVNDDTTANGKLFTDAVPDPSTTLSCITNDVCDILYRKVSEIRNITKITVTVKDFNGISDAYATATPGESGIDISSRYLQQVSDAHGDVAAQIRGLLYYHATNIYQFNDNNGGPLGWVIAGVANYVRHTAGYVSDDLRRAGGAYDDGGNTTGFFFIWLDQKYPLFVYELNLSLDPNDGITWSTKAFQDITGQTVDMLWASYQATL